MPTYKKALCLGLCAIGLSLFFSTFALSTSTPSQTVYLYQNGQHIKIGPHQLLLEDLNPMIAWFSDAPSRHAGKLGLTNYMQFWQAPSGSLWRHHPTTTIVAYLPTKSGKPSKEVTITAVLNHAYYDKHGNVIRYTISHVYTAHGQTRLNHTIILSRPSLFMNTPYVNASGLNTAVHSSNTAAH